MDMNTEVSHMELNHQQRLYKASEAQRMTQRRSYRRLCRARPTLDDCAHVGHVLSSRKSVAIAPRWAPSGYNG